MLAKNPATRNRKRPEGRIPASYEAEAYRLAVDVLRESRATILDGWRRRFKSELGQHSLKIAPGMTGLTAGPKARFVVGIRGLIDKAANRVSYTYGNHPADDWRVVNPAVYAAIENAAVHLCETTQQWIEQATGDEAAKIIDQIRRDLLAHQKSGQTLASLTDKLATYFDQSVRWKARQIARTESARAYNTGYLLATQDDPWVVGYEWLLSDDACDYCKRIGSIGDRGRRIRKNDIFHFDGKAAGPYQAIIAPPLHPNCFCTIIPVLQEDGIKKFDGQYDPAISPEPESIPKPEPKPKIASPKPKPDSTIKSSPTPIGVRKSDPWRFEAWSNS